MSQNFALSFIHKGIEILVNRFYKMSETVLKLLRGPTPVDCWVVKPWLYETPTELESIIDALCCTTVLKRVAFHRDVSPDVVLRVFQHNTTITELELVYSPWSDLRWCNGVLTGLQNAQLTNFIVTVGPEFSNDTAWGHILQACITMPQLCKLTLRSNSFAHQHIPKDLLLTLAPRLTTLNLETIALNAEFLGALFQDQVFKKVRLRHCINDSGVIVMYQLFAGLHTLHLDDNELTGSSGELLGRVLVHNNTMRVLSVKNNRLQRQGGTAIAQGLRQNTMLQTLNLANNGLDIVVGEAFGQALEVNRTLKTLHLYKNSLGDGQPIATALKKNYVLTHLDVMYTGVLFTPFARMLLVNRGLQYLYIKGPFAQAKDLLDVLTASAFLEFALTQNATILNINWEDFYTLGVAEAFLRNRWREHDYWSSKQHHSFLPRWQHTVRCILLSANRFPVRLPWELWVEYVLPCLRFPDF